MVRYVQSGAFVGFFGPQSKPGNQVQDLEDHEGGDEGVAHGGNHRDEVIAEQLEFTVDDADTTYGEDRRGKCAPDAADAVNGEHFKGVVKSKLVAVQDRDVGQDPGAEANRKTTHGAYKSSGRSYRNQSGYGTGGGSDGWAVQSSFAGLNVQLEQVDDAQQATADYPIDLGGATLKILGSGGDGDTTIGARIVYVL